MGTSNSKPTNPSSQEHVFTASAPLSLSPSLHHSLETTPTSNRTRTSDQELLIQKRVHEELSRLERSANDSLRQTLDSDALTPSPNGKPGDDKPSLDGTEAQGAGADAQSLHSAQQQRLANLSREGVQAEIEGLKKRLGERREREGKMQGRKGEEGKEVERAREKLVECLRVNDRRPLDCLEEVEGFKREVGRLEEGVLRGVWER